MLQNLFIPLFLYKKVNVTGWCGGCDNDGDDDIDVMMMKTMIVVMKNLLVDGGYTNYLNFSNIFFVKRRRWMIEADKFLNENTENADYNQVSI